MSSSLNHRFIVQIQRATDYSLTPEERVENLNGVLYDILHINAVISEVPGYTTTNTDKLQVLVKYIRDTIGRKKPLCIGFIMPNVFDNSFMATFKILDAGDAYKAFMGIGIYDDIEKAPVVKYCEQMDDSVTELIRNDITIVHDETPIEIELIHVMSII